MMSIHSAREVYNSSSEENRMHSFVNEFTKLHKFSMVAYPVGMHYDTFKKGRESLENKILFSIPIFEKDNRGRGGCIFMKKFVFALLDW